MFEMLFNLLYGPQADVKIMTQSCMYLVCCSLPLVLATDAHRPLFHATNGTPPSEFGTCTGLHHRVYY